MEAQLCEERTWQLSAGGNSADKRLFSLANGAQGVHAGALRQIVGYHVALFIQRIEENPAIELHYKTKSSA